MITMLQLHKNIVRKFCRETVKFNMLSGNCDESGNVQPERLPALVALYTSLLKEESKELDEALLNNDKVEVIDAVADCLVVGLWLQYCSNLQNFPDLKWPCFVDMVVNNVTTPTAYTDIEYLADDFLAYIREGAISDAFTLGFAFPVDPRFLEEVSYSNLSKFYVMDVEAANEWAEELEKDKGVKVGVVQQVGHTIFYRKLDGKVLKGKGFNPPELEKYLMR